MDVVLLKIMVMYKLNVHGLLHLLGIWDGLVMVPFGASTLCIPASCLSTSTSRCPSHSCRNVRILPESTGMGQESAGMGLESTGIHRNETGFCRNGIYWIKLLLYIYIYLYLLNSLHIYKYLYFYICIYWSAFIYLNYCLVPFNIMNLQGLEMHGDTSQAS